VYVYGTLLGTLHSGKQKLNFRQLLLKNAQKVKGKDISPAMLDTVQHSLKSPLPLKSPHISKKSIKDKRIHFSPNGTLTPFSEEFTRVPLPPIPRTSLSPYTMELLTLPKK
jgi:hypothetical protein